MNFMFLVCVILSREAYGCTKKESTYLRCKLLEFEIFQDKVGDSLFQVMYFHSPRVRDLSISGVAFEFYGNINEFHSFSLI